MVRQGHDAILLLVLVVAGTAAAGAWGEAPARLEVEREQVNLTADGRCTRLAEKVFVLGKAGGEALCRGMLSVPQRGAVVRDEKGRAARLESEKDGKHYVWRFRLAGPARKGARLTYRLVDRQARLVKKEGAVWLYDRSHRVLPNVSYYHTVVLPAGAQPVLVKPAPLKTYLDKGLPVLQFGAVVSEPRDLRLTIKYGFPEQPPAK